MLEDLLIKILGNQIFLICELTAMIYLVAGGIYLIGSVVKHLVEEEHEHME